MTSHARQREFLWLAGALFLFNVVLVAPLFVTERTAFQGSIEGAFIGLARFFSEHPNPFGWYPFWYGGTPVQFTYTPGLHYLNGLVLRLLPLLEPGQAYHAVGAAMFSLGSVTAAYLVYFFTRQRWWAFGAGLLYSLWSPAIWLIGDISRDSVGFEAPWRLQVLVKYGEGPHTASLMLIPLAICALWKTVHERRFPPLFTAALLLAAIVLINWVGAFALGAVFFCFLLTVAWQNPGFGLRPAVWRALLAGVLAYLLAAFWITPAFIRTVAFNAQTVSGHYEYQWGMLVLLAGALIGLVGIRWVFRAFPEQRYLCLLALISFFFGYLTLNSHWFRWYMIPQPHRYVPEFELFLILMVCEIFRLALGRLTGRRRRVAIVAMAVLAVGAVVQARNYLPRSHRMLPAAPVTQWAEYKLARWLGAHVAPQDRIYIIGSEGISLNEWVDVAQVKGWFDPGVRDQLTLHISHQISSSDNAPEGRDGEIAVVLLKVIGARYVVVHGPQSKVAYHDFPRPLKFEGLLPAVHRVGSDAVIYEVPGVRLAHLVRPDELATKTPVNGLDIKPLARYVAAVGDPARPVLVTRWITPNRLEIQGEFSPGYLVSLRVSHAEGWRAYQGSTRIPAERDRLGFLVLRPQPDPEGRLRLEYVGELEQRICGWISFVTLGVGVVIFFYRRVVPN